MMPPMVRLYCLVGALKGGALETSAPPLSAPTEQVGCVGMAGMPYPPNLCPSVQSVGEYLASETSVVSVVSVGR